MKNTQINETTETSIGNIPWREHRENNPEASRQRRHMTTEKLVQSHVDASIALVKAAGLPISHPSASFCLRRRHARQQIPHAYKLVGKRSIILNVQSKQLHNQILHTANIPFLIV